MGKDKNTVKNGAKLLIAFLVALFSVAFFWMGMHDMDRGYNLAKINACELLGIRMAEETINGNLYDGPSAYMQGLIKVVYAFPFMICSICYFGIFIGGHFHEQ